MNIQDELDIIYKRQAEDFLGARLKRVAAEKPAKRRKAILEAINNYPNNWKPSSLFDAIINGFPNVRRMRLLKTKERVIIKRFA